MSEIEQNIEIEVSGVKHEGSYVIDEGMITVFYGERSTTTQVGGSLPGSLARLMLREFVKSTTH